jgi:hypothetical protein
MDAQMIIPLRFADTPLKGHPIVVSHTNKKFQLPPGWFSEDEDTAPMAMGDKPSNISLSGNKIKSQKPSSISMTTSSNLRGFKIIPTELIKMIFEL